VQRACYVPAPGYYYFGGELDLVINFPGEGSQLRGKYIESRFLKAISFFKPSVRDSNCSLSVEHSPDALTLFGAQRRLEWE
jgi:hypothetical protein